MLDGIIAFIDARAEILQLAIKGTPTLSEKDAYRERCFELDIVREHLLTHYWDGGK